jgi:hypothetical protein
MNYEQPTTAAKITPVSQSLDAMTAGTTYTGYLKFAPVIGSKGRICGYFHSSTDKETSFTPDGVALTTEVKTADLVLGNGQYYINYETGYYKVKSASTRTPTVTYKVRIQMNFV